jgi:hypothetical protein
MNRMEERERVDAVVAYVRSLRAETLP